MYIIYTCNVYSCVSLLRSSNVWSIHIMVNICGERVNCVKECLNILVASASRQAILKKNSVSGVAAGWFKNVRMGTFFSFLQKIFFFSKNGQYFPTQKKIEGKKKKCGLPTGFKNGHPLDRKQKFFLGWPHGQWF